MRETEFRRAFYVFGSNRAGLHRAGPSLRAVTEYGASHGIGEGMTGYAYALPVRNCHQDVLPIDEIASYVNRFLQCANEFNKRRFNVTDLACGLKGIRRADVIELFRPACVMPNLYWPQTWAETFGSTRVSFDREGNARR
jgi:hypothetical protein